MSSRFGPRASGTDGSDFHHRQKVATHYRDSVVYKFRLKILLLLHGLLGLPMVIKLVEDLLDRIGRPCSLLTRLQLPDAQLWEWCWLLSAIPLVLGLSAMPKNNEEHMRYSYYGIFSLGVMPVVVGMGTHFPQLFEYIGDPHIEVDMFLGRFPMVVLWFMFFFVALQVHIFTLYFTFQLIKVWRPLPAPAAKTDEQSKSMEDMKKTE